MCAELIISDDLTVIFSQWYFSGLVDCIFCIAHTYFTRSLQPNAQPWSGPVDEMCWKKLHFQLVLLYLPNQKCWQPFIAVSEIIMQLGFFLLSEFCLEVMYWKNLHLLNNRSNVQQNECNCP